MDALGDAVQAGERFQTTVVFPTVVDDVVQKVLRDDSEDVIWQR
jgi:hypothetical protein